MFCERCRRVPLLFRFAALKKELICEDRFDQPFRRCSRTEKLVGIRLDFRYDLDKVSLRNSRSATTKGAEHDVESGFRVPNSPFTIHHS